MVFAVILAGGRGERFWPRSRAGKPKQFTDLTGSGSMLALTYRRTAGLVQPEHIFVLTGREYEEITRETLPELPAENLLIEPAGRNTAPCIGLAAVILAERCPDATMIVLPADHLVKEEDKFIDTLQAAVELARDTQGLVTLGIRPTRAETGYGYLQVGRQVAGGKTAGKKAGLVYLVSRFIEKPDQARAEQFLADGSYLWNAGIFIWQVPVILEAFRTYLPEVYAGLQKIRDAFRTGEYEEVLNSLYPRLPKISVDYGIMEKADRVYTIPGDFTWDDLGTWQALARVVGTDRDGNVLRGNAVALQTTNTIVDAGERLVAVLGVEDLVVVDTEDITFICKKSQANLIRELLAALRGQNLVRYL